ncbi:MAG: hypothetical protein EYC70_01285 [Planctomycetota bacterium]|nr:MAG: hypothetical protein EYC70_01285 [Planctomycetota bacterium]
MPTFWQRITGRASNQRLPEDPDEPDLDTRLDEATGEVARLAQAADDPAQADSLARFLQGEPEDDDRDLLIPQTPAEIAATRQLGHQRYRNWGMTGTRATAGQVVGRLTAAVAGVPGIMASQGPNVLNMAHTEAGAMSLRALSDKIPAGANVYEGRAAELKEAISRVARIRDAKASGQATSIGASVAVSFGAAAATPFLVAAVATAAAPPVAVGLALAGGGAAAGVAISKGVGLATRKVVEAVSDIDRDRIAAVLFKSARQEIVFNQRVDQERAEADQAEAADRSQLRERPEPVREYAVEALAAIGVARELLVNASTDDRVKALVRRFLS